jgi:hypothetical protein
LAPIYPSLATRVVFRGCTSSYTARSWRLHAVRGPPNKTTTCCGHAWSMPPPMTTTLRATKDRLVHHDTRDRHDCLHSQHNIYLTIASCCEAWYLFDFMHVYIALRTSFVVCTCVCKRTACPSSSADRRRRCHVAPCQTRDANISELIRALTNCSSDLAENWLDSVLRRIPPPKYLLAILHNVFVRHVRIHSGKQSGRRAAATPLNHGMH